MDVLIMRLEAPLMSFGGAIVDNYGVIRDYPSLSMLTGLFGNALGYVHGDIDKLQRLQERILFAVRCDREGEKMQDYQTVDLGQDYLVDTGWTTRGKREDRGGASSKETHIRYRDYLADAVYTIAFTLDESAESPTIAELATALQHPARPLFIGRKPCLPSGPLFSAVVDAPSPLIALENLPGDKRGDDKPAVRAWWHARFGDRPQSRKTALYDTRDWRNQIHAGRRFIYEGLLPVREVAHAG